MALDYATKIRLLLDPSLATKINDFDRVQLIYLIYAGGGKSSAMDDVPTLRRNVLSVAAKFAASYNPIADEPAPPSDLIGEDLDTDKFGIDFNTIIADGNYAVVVPAYALPTSYVAKVQKWGKDDKRGNLCLSMEESVRREMIIARQMSELKVGPTVYSTTIDEEKEGKRAIMIMDRYDDTLRTVFWQEQKKRDEKDFVAFRSAYMKQVDNLVKKMHAAGVVHRDLHLDNVLFRARGVDGQPDIRIGDFGFAMYSTDERLQMIDWKSLDTDTNHFGTVQYTRGGVPCEDI